VAQTALKSRRLIALLLCVLPDASWGQDPTSLGSILDTRGTEATHRSSEGDDALDSLRLLDGLHIAGRHRFIVPLPRSESGIGISRLREKLQDLRILDVVGDAIDAKASAAKRGAEEAAARGNLAGSSRLHRCALGLRSVLQVAPPQRDDSVRTWPWDSVRVSRATEPLSLLAWNRGAYQVATTPNFSVASQAADRPTADMAQACELAYEVWTQLFAEGRRSNQTENPNSDGTTSSKRFQVVMFRTRDAYIKALRSIEPKIGVSTGYYSPEHRISFFYWDGPKSLPTLVHELTHQFFHEWSGQESHFDSNRDPGFWAVEGVALYLESFSMRKVGGAAIIDIGGWDSSRLQASRYRRLHDKYWIPWDQFSALNGGAFRNSNEIAAWYSQACGLAHRYLDGREEDFRQFKDYLHAVYEGKGGEASQRLAPDDDSLRAGYDHYLTTSWRSGNWCSGNLPTDNPFEIRPFFPNRREAVLSRCDVKSGDLLAWPSGCRNMEWLDLSFTGVDDAWLVEAGDPPWQIHRLNLESTAIADNAMVHLASMHELRELDLTQCEVTDRGLEALRNHPNLRQLWLGRTRITDASIDTLLSLPRLERVAIEGSEVSDAGWKQILSKKPYLKH
jgi:hypothetical protein